MMLTRAEVADIFATGIWDQASKLRGSVISMLMPDRASGLRIDRGVRIRNLHKVRFGKACWLKENVILDGRCDGAVGIDIGDGVVIRTGTYIDAYGGEGFVKLGSHAGIGQHVYIGGNGGVTIEEDVMISGHVYMVSATHNLNLGSGIPYRSQGEVRQGIIIRRNAWVAAGCIVIDGVEIGENSVVGAGSVVTRSIPSGVVAVGCPARVVRDVATGSMRRSDII